MKLPFIGTLIVVSAAAGLYGCTTIEKKPNADWRSEQLAANRVLHLCMDGAINEYDDSISTASDIANVVVMKCNREFEKMEWAYWEGEELNPILASKARTQIAVRYILEQRIQKKNKKS